MKNGISSRAAARLGQNFLADAGAQRRIVDALGADADGAVVEIGPGGAAITDLLAARASRLIAIELDRELAARLQARFAGSTGVEIVEADVLSVDLGALAPRPGRSLAVVGNLPYYITSPILQHLFAHEAAISRAVVMVQREVAERMTAVPGASAYGLLSVLCRLHAELTYLFTLPPEAFRPAPAVESAVVRMDFRPRWAELGVEPESFRRFLRSAFAQKRKTLANNLRSSGIAASDVSNTLQACNVSTKARAEELSPESLSAVWRSLRDTAAFPA